MAANVLNGRNDAIDPRDVNYYTSTLNISAMSDRELQMVLRRAYRRFYLNPKRILRVVIYYPKVLSLPRYVLITLIRILRRKRSDA